MCMGQLCASVSFFVYVIQCYTSTTLKWKSIYASYAIAPSCEINHNHVLLFLFIRHTHETMCQHTNISPKNYWTKKKWQPKLPIWSAWGHTTSNLWRWCGKWKQPCALCVVCVYEWMWENMQNLLSMQLISPRLSFAHFNSERERERLW